MNAWIVLEADNVVGLFPNEDSARSGLWTYVVENELENESDMVFQLQLWEGTVNHAQVWLTVEDVMMRGK